MKIVILGKARSKVIRGILSLAVAAGFCSLPIARAQVATRLAAAYTIMDLGAVPGSQDYSFAYKVNNAGQVIGASEVNGNATFVWDMTNGFRNFPGVTLQGINNQGVAIGVKDGSSAVTWDATNSIQVQTLGPPDGAALFIACAINDAGAIAYLNYNGSSSAGKTYLTTDRTNWTWIGELPSLPFTVAESLNNKNEMVGYTFSGGYGAFFWSASQGITNLGTLPGYAYGQAKSVNDSSQVVGFCYTADGTRAPFIWTANNGMTQLGIGDIGGSQYTANAISAGGIAVGQCMIGGTEHAIAWPPGQNAVDLNTLVTNLDLNGWTTIHGVNGINSFGVMVGSGLRTNGVTHAYMLYPLNPPSITKQPQSQVAYWGQTVTFSVGFTNLAPPLVYQWQFDGTNILGATNALLVITNLQTANAGAYVVTISDSGNTSLTSAPANLTVYPPGVSLGLYPGLSITGAVGYTYIVQSTTDLSNTNSWATLTNVTLTQSTQLWVDTNSNASLPGNPPRFYRVLPGQ